MNVIDVLTETRVRLYRDGDVIPKDLALGFDQLGRIDEDWLWIIDDAGEIKGVLAAANCHGLVLIYRLSVAPGVPFRYLAGLLRTFLRDVRGRGMVGYLTWINPERPAERKLQRIMERAGAKQVGTPHIAVSGPIPKEGI